MVLDANAHEIFLFFDNNRVRGCPTSSPWEKNLGKLLVPEVSVDVDLVKALIIAYNPSTRILYNEDKSILCFLDKNVVIEDFGLGGPMSRKIDIEHLNKMFKESTNSFTKGAMKRHIIKDKLDVGDIPKKLTTTMPMEYFKPYF